MGRCRGNQSLVPALPLTQSYGRQHPMTSRKRRKRSLGRGCGAHARVSGGGDRGGWQFWGSAQTVQPSDRKQGGWKPREGGGGAPSTCSQNEKMLRVSQDRNSVPVVYSADFKVTDNRNQSKQDDCAPHHGHRGGRVKEARAAVASVGGCGISCLSQGGGGPSNSSAFLTSPAVRMAVSDLTRLAS